MTLENFWTAKVRENLQWINAKERIFNRLEKY